MKKKLLLFMILILIVSTNVFATDVNTQDTIIKTIVVNKTEENNFLKLLDNTIEIDNIKYNLQSKDRQELESVSSKMEEQIKTLELTTNKKDKILHSFEESIKYDDGEFLGELYRQDNSLKVTTIKHGKYEKVFTINKQYTNLEESDLDYIPKEIVKDDCTYYLTQCDWYISENEDIQNISIPKTYTATTTYKTVKTLEYPYTYKCELTYNGEVNKISKDNVQYTLTYKKQPKEEIEENKTSILPYLGGTGVFLVIIYFLLPNAKITNYYNGKYKTIKYIRVSTKNPKINLKHLPNAKTNVFSVKFSNRLDKKLVGKAVIIMTPKATFKKMIINKSIEVHL